MASKNYMTDWEGLEEAIKTSGSTKWNLYRGFVNNHANRSVMIYKQDNDEIDHDQSFEDLKKRIEWNSAGGGDFTVFIPGKASNHGYSIWFRVPGVNSAATASVAGLPVNYAQMGFVTREELDRERRLWELERENEELQEAINGPSNFWQNMLAGVMQDGTVQELIKGVVEMGKIYMQQKMAPVPGARVAMQGFPPVQNPAPEPADDSAEPYEYDDKAFDFLDSVRITFGGNEQAFYKFLDDLRTVYESNPQGSVTMIQFQANQIRQQQNAPTP